MENPIAEEIIDIVQNELLFEKIEVAVLPEFVSPAIEDNIQKLFFESIIILASRPSYAFSHGYTSYNKELPAAGHLLPLAGIRNKAHPFFSYAFRKPEAVQCRREGQVEMA